MRISKFMLPAVTLAGALALAGCGGESSTPASDPGGNGDREEGDMMPPAGGNSQLTELKLPATANFGRTNQNRNQGSIPAGDHLDIGNVRVSCPTGTTPCNYEVRGGKIYANNGAMADEATPPAAPRVESEGGGNDWLSDASLIRAVKSGGTVEILRNGVEYVLPPIPADAVGVETNVAFNSDDTVQASGGATRSIVVDAGGGLETELRLSHTRGRSLTDVDRDRDRGLPGDYLVFGAWETRTAAKDDDDTEGDDTRAAATDPVTGSVWAGTIRRTDRAAWGIGTARYEGKAFGHYKYDAIADKDDWHHWEGSIDLHAQFAPDVNLINGFVDTNITTDVPGGTAITAGNEIRRVNLLRTKIGASVDGEANIEGAGGGTWQAEFFGSATNGQPTGVAGGFRTVRETRGAGQLTTPRGDGSTFTTTVTARDGAIIQGAFGAHNVDAITLNNPRFLTGR